MVLGVIGILLTHLVPLKYRVSQRPQNAIAGGSSKAHCGQVMRRAPSLILCLLQPVRHPHLSIHRRRGSEVLLRLLALACAPVELAEAEVAVGDERAHAELAGERQRFAVICLGLFTVRWIGPGGDLSEEPKGPHFVATLFVLP